MIYPLLQRDKRGVPALCDDSSIKPTVKSLENGEKLRGSVVVLECELDQRVMNTAICIGNIQPAHS